MRSDSTTQVAGHQMTMAPLLCRSVNCSETLTHTIMRTLTLAFLFAVIVSNRPVQGQGAQPAKSKEPSLRLDLATEDARPARIKVEIKSSEARPKVIRKMEDVSSGLAELALSGVTNGNYFVFFSSPGYAAQWQALTVKQGKAEPDKMGINLFRQRYVVLRYAFNTSGGRVLSGRSVTEGRAAVAHWGGLPYFQQDWQIWQKSLGTDLFGDTPYLEFHRYSKGFGFAKAPKGVAFDDLKEAPAKTEYRCANLKAEKGLTLFCRIEANRKEGLGYGKVVVEDVTETPPAGVKVISAP